MKKLFVLFLTILLTFPLFSQETERELSDYEKYRMAQEQEILVPDTIEKDTIVIERQTEPVVINNYYIEDNQPDYRYLITFGYRPYYYYSYYDPFYYDYWYGYNTYYHNGYYPYRGYNSYYYNSYHRYNYHYNYYSRPNGRHYASSSSLGWSKQYYMPYNKTYRSGYVNSPTAMKKSSYSMSRKVTTTTLNKPQQNRSYSPTYTKPKMSTMPSYNRTTTSRESSTTTRPRTIQQSTPNRSSSSYVRPSTSSRSTTTYSRSVNPSRSSSTYRSSTPSGSSYSRSSGTSRSYSSGSTSRGLTSSSKGRK